MALSPIRVINPLIAPLTTLLYGSVREGVYCVAYISGSIHSAGVQLMQGLLTQGGMRVGVASPQQLGKELWSDCSLFSAQKMIADMRDTGVSLIICVVPVADVSSPFVGALTPDMVVFDTGIDQIVDTSAISHFLQSFYRVQRGQKILVYPKDHKTFYDLVRDNPCDKSLSYSSQTDASFTLHYVDDMTAQCHVLGAVYTVQRDRPISAAMYPVLAVGYAAVYALAQDVSMLLDSMRGLDMHTLLSMASISDRGRTLFRGKKDLVSSFYLPSSGSVLLTSSYTADDFTKYAVVVIVPPDYTHHIAYDGYKPGGEKQHHALRGSRLFVFATRAYGLLFVSSVYPNASCIIDAPLAVIDRDKQSFRIP